MHGRPPLNSRGPCPAMLYDLNVPFRRYCSRMWVTLSTRSAAAALLLVVVLLSCSAVGAEASRRSSRVSRIPPNSTIGKGAVYGILSLIFSCLNIFARHIFNARALLSRKHADRKCFEIFFKKLGGDERQF